VEPRPLRSGSALGQVNDADTRRRLTVVQRAVAHCAPGLAPGLVRPEKMHLSLCLLRCDGVAAVARAAEALEACRPELARALAERNGSKAELELSGLEAQRGAALFVDAALRGGADEDKMASLSPERRQGALDGRLGGLARAVQERMREARAPPHPPPPPPSY
jgi:hypothetical protein